MVTEEFIFFYDLVYESLYDNLDVVLALNILKYVGEYLLGKGQYADENGAIGVKLYI